MHNLPDETDISSTDFFIQIHGGHAPKTRLLFYYIWVNRCVFFAHNYFPLILQYFFKLNADWTMCIIKTVTI